MKYWLWLLIIIGSAIAVAGVTFIPALANLSTGLRLCVSLWFLIICPGMAFVPLLRLSNAGDEWTLAIAISLALDTLVAEFMLYTERWSPPSILLILICLSLIGLILQLLLLRQAPAQLVPELAEVPADSERSVSE